MVRVFWHLLTFGVLAAALSSSCALSRPTDCAAPALIVSSAITLVGEVHGTTETPAWVGEVACALSQRHEVVVALEVATDEQERLDAYMGSEGTPADRNVLIAGPFWKGSDGRASEAMVALIERLRELSQQGRRVSIAAVDDWQPTASRDAVMADAIRRIHITRPEARIVALLGNNHAGTIRRKPPMRPDDQPVGYFLQDLAPYSVLVEFNGGTAWVCTPACGPSPSRSNSGQPREPGFYPGEPWLPGYQAAVNLGHVTPSVPVTHRGP